MRKWFKSKVLGRKEEASPPPKQQEHLRRLERDGEEAYARIQHVLHSLGGVAANPTATPTATPRPCWRALA